MTKVKREVKDREWFSDFDCYLFGEGKHYRIYEKLGAHLTERDGQSGVYFAVWAPHAQEVSVVGDFNNWDASKCLMVRNSMGIWEVFVSGLKPGTKYKYAIKNAQGHCCFKTDPYGYQQELRPATASMVTDLSYSWQDQSWLDKRRHTNPLDGPISIYEVHLGSWLHSSLDNLPENIAAVPVPHKPGARFLTYRELANQLIPYVKEIGYTHIELLPVTEHPFDGSWGTQN